MAAPTPTFRDQLLNFEPLDPQRQKQLEQQVRDLVDRRITGLQWVYWIAILLAGGLGAVFLLRSMVLGIAKAAAVGAAVGDPVLFVLLMWLGAALCVLGALFALLVMLRRRVQSQLRLVFGKIMPAVAGLLIVITFLYGCDDPAHKPEATWLGVYALAAFVFTSSINLWNRVVAADQRAQSHMLRIEYRLAELAERLPPPQQKQ